MDQASTELRDMNAPEHFPISVSTLWPTAAVGLDLFLLDKSGAGLKLFKSADYPLEMADLENLQRRNIKTLYVASTHRDQYQSYLRNIVRHDNAGPKVPIEIRVGALAEVVRDVLEQVFERHNPEVCIAEAMKLGAMTADLLESDQFAKGELFRVLHHDYATFTHSANVGLYAGMLAKELSMSADEVQSIVIGAFLHDLGKLEIDDRILCKPGRLNEQEMNEIKRHPTTGFRCLAHRVDLTEGQLLMVYQHHERLDGRGYPVGVPDSEIHPWAKICAVVDVFEALTSFRPYRSPMSKERTLQLLESESGTAYDPEILSCWTKIIQTNYVN